MPKTHRRSRTRLWWAWCAAKQRCQNPKSKDYSSYGGRGIRLCERWQSFEAFLADVGERPSPLHSLDRIDNNKGYEPRNVRWATSTEQARNRRRRDIRTYSRGEQNGASKLTFGIVSQLRKRRAAGESYGTLARAFGVSRMTVTRACRGETWGGA